MEVLLVLEYRILARGNIFKRLASADAKRLLAVVSASSDDSLRDFRFYLYSLVIYIYPIRYSNFARSRSQHLSRAPPSTTKRAGPPGRWSARAEMGWLLAAPIPRAPALLNNHTKFSSACCVYTLICIHSGHCAELFVFHCVCVPVCDVLHTPPLFDRRTRVRMSRKSDLNMIPWSQGQ